jgi:hypothetical protein
MIHELSTDTVDNTKCYAKDVQRCSASRRAIRNVARTAGTKLHKATVQVMLLCRTAKKVHESDQHRDSESILVHVLVELLGPVDPGQAGSMHYDWGRPTWLSKKTYVLCKQMEVQGYV